MMRRQSAGGSRSRNVIIVLITMSVLPDLNLLPSHTVNKQYNFQADYFSLLQLYKLVLTRQTKHFGLNNRT